MKITLDNNVNLSGAPLDLTREMLNYFTIENPAYMEAEKHNRSTRDIELNLKFYSKHPVDGSMVLPRGAANRIRQMALKYGHVDVEDNRLELPEIDLTFHGNLRPYQQQACREVTRSAFSTLEAGTGSGKTVMTLAVIAHRRQPTLILVHNKELLYQWRDRIKQFLGIEAGLIGDGKLKIQPVTVGVVNSVLNHLDSLTDRFGQVVVDECHRTPSTMFTKAVSAFPAKYTLGLSATPYRRDGLTKLIGWFVGEHKALVDITVLHEVGAVLRPKIINHETEFQYTYDEDYQPMISALTEDRDRNKLIAADIQQQAKQGGLSLVVSDRVAHLETLAAMTGVDHHVLTGKTPAKKRKEIVASLAAGEVPVLFSTLSLIGEGFDCPSMDSLFLTTPIKFTGRLTQVVGRVLRPEEDKQPLVYDYCDVDVGLLKHQWKCRKKILDNM